MAVPVVDAAGARWVAYRRLRLRLLCPRLLCLRRESVVRPKPRLSMAAPMMERLVARRDIGGGRFALSRGIETLPAATGVGMAATGINCSTG